MPMQIDFGQPPCGYAVTSAAKKDEDVQVQYCEFTSTEDGQHFIKRLEGFPDTIVRSLSPAVSPAQVEHLLAICERSGKATVYVNELKQRIRVKAARPVLPGAKVSKSDIAEVEHLELGVEIPSDAGMLFLFSVGWRKGLFYDFGPLHPEGPTRQFDLAVILGQAYCHVLFQERFSISDVGWTNLFAAKWFPFVGLGNQLIESLIGYVQSGLDPDQNLDDIVMDVKGRLSEMLGGWLKQPSFQPHTDILSRAVDRFQNDDWTSCTALLYPRIEGILRTHHTSLGTATKPNPSNLTKSAVSAKVNNEKCLLMPHRFANYLQDVYFADFNPVAQNIDVSRHSVAHGVAAQSEFNMKSAVIAVLVVNQLSHFLSSEGPVSTTT